MRDRCMIDYLSLVCCEMRNGALTAAKAVRKMKVGRLGRWRKLSTKWHR